EGRTVRIEIPGRFENAGYGRLVLPELLPQVIHAPGEHAAVAEELSGIQISLDGLQIGFFHEPVDGETVQSLGLNATAIGCDVSESGFGPVGFDSEGDQGASPLRD